MLAISVQYMSLTAATVKLQNDKKSTMKIIIKVIHSPMNYLPSLLKQYGSFV